MSKRNFPLPQAQTQPRVRMAQSQARSPFFEADPNKTVEAASAPARIQSMNETVFGISGGSGIPVPFQPVPPGQPLSRPKGR